MKLIKALVVMLVAVGMILPAVAVAEDRLSLSGEMRVRGWYLDQDWDDFEDPKDDSTDTFADQRLRIAGKIAVAEGVSLSFRTDITETAWGSGSNGPGNAARGGSSQQWDRAHMDLTFSNGFHLRAGQQFFGTFGTNAWDTQDPGLSFDFNPGVKITGFFVVDNQNGDSSDTLQSGLIIAPEGDNFKAKVFVVNQSKGQYATSQWEDNLATLGITGVDLDYTNESVYLIGASGSMMLGPVNLFAEVDFFTGDSFTVTDADGSEDLDAMGTQVFLDASMAATDAFTIGGQFFYAAGDDEDIQYTGLGNRFNGWDPVFDVGTSLSNEQMTFNSYGTGDYSLFISPFDWTNWNAGSVSGRLYGNFKASEDLSFGASATYLSTEEDDAADADAYALAAGFVYSLLPNTSLQAQVQYTDGTIDEIAGVDVDGDFNVFSAGTGLFVKF
ncbi:MAG: hypothetical protein JRE56_09730 [Deltaproteobacteria bacterium]|jgi:hypothetical protein|nr:hypothetical protein [Deltaproteobacteria bacterium]